MTVSEISQIVEKAARIIYFGLLNPKKISSNNEYQNLYREYVISSELQEYVKAIAQAFNLYIIAVERDAVYLSPKKDSPFLPRISDIPILGKEKNRGIYVLIVVAIAAYFFPDTYSFQERGLNKIGLDAESLHNFIINRIEQIKDEKGDSILNMDRDQPDLHRLLGTYYSMNKASDINPQSTSTYFIEKTFEYLKKQRLLTSDNNKFIPTSKFKLQMEDFSNNEYYIQFLRSLIKRSGKMELNGGNQ